MADLNVIAQRMLSSSGAEATPQTEPFQTQLRSEALDGMFGDNEAAPQIPLSRRGRSRLTRTLSSRFGKNFRAVPQAAEAMRTFDEDFGHLRQLAQNALSRDDVPEEEREA